MVRRERSCLAAFVLLLPSLGVSHARAEEKNFPPEARRKYEEAKELQDKGLYQEAVRAYEEAIDLGMQAFPRAHLYKANSNLNSSNMTKLFINIPNSLPISA